MNTCTRRSFGLALLLVASFLTACISVLPDDPTVLPEGPVTGLVPVYLSDAAAHTISLRGDNIGLVLLEPERRLAVDTLTLWLDTLIGVRIGRIDSFGQLTGLRLLRVPGITQLGLDAEGSLTFSNFGDLVTGRFDGPDTFVEISRLPDAAPLPPTYPLLVDLRRNPDTDRPGPLIEERYFACYDSTLGFVDGWIVGTITEAPCLTSVFQ